MIATTPPTATTRPNSAAQASCAGPDRCENTLNAVATSTTPSPRTVGGAGVTVSALTPGSVLFTRAVISGSTSAANNRWGATRVRSTRLIRPHPEPKSRTRAVDSRGGLPSAARSDAIADTKASASANAASNERPTKPSCTASGGLGGTVVRTSITGGRESMAAPEAKRAARSLISMP